MTPSKKKRLIYLAFLLVIVPRFLYLDQDVPAYMISGLCQEDEPYYSIGGVNKFLKEMHPEMAEVKSPIATGVQLFITPISYVSFKIFGNNYWALRIPLAVMGCLVLLMYFMFIQKKISEFRHQLFLILFFASDFYFFLFSRFNNPQLQSIFIISIICYLYCVPPRSGKWKYFFIGFLAVFLITAVYLYNMFVLAAVGLTTLIFAVRERKYTNVLWLMAGGIIAFAVLLVGFWHYNINVQKLIQTLFSIADNRDEISVKMNMIDMFKKYVYTVLQFAATNFIRYNLGYMILILTGIFLILKEKKILKNEYNLFFLICIITLFFQSVFVVSYPFKKHIIFLPILCFFIINQWQSIVDFNYNELLKKGKYLFLLVLSFATALVIYNVKVNNAPAYWAPFGYGYYENINLIYIALNCVVAVLLICSFFIPKKIGNYFKLLLILPGSLLIVDYCFINRSYITSEGLRSMNDKYKDKIFVEGFSHALQFYSELVPTVSVYDRGNDYSYAEIDSLYKSSQPTYNTVKYFANDAKMERSQIGDTLSVQSRKFVLENKLNLKYYSFAILRYINADE